MGEEMSDEMSHTHTILSSMNLRVLLRPYLSGNLMVKKRSMDITHMCHIELVHKRMSDVT